MLPIVKTVLLFGLLALSSPALAEPPVLVPVTYAHVKLQWEQLEAGAWKPVEQWKQPKMKAGAIHTWDTTVTQAATTQRMLLRVTWAGKAPRVEVEGGFAYLSSNQDPVRIRVARGLADGQAWTFGVPTAKELVGHRVVAHVRLETVMEPKVSDASAMR